MMLPMVKPLSSFIGLQGLIPIIVLLAVLATRCNGVIVAYDVQRDQLIHSSLEANRAYALKVAASIDEFLLSLNQRLSYSSRLLGSDFSNPQLLKTEAVRLQAQDSELSAVLIMDAQGSILEAFPRMPGLVGSTITSTELKQALVERRPLISDAYTDADGQLVVFVSQPIFNAEGAFLGMVGGSVHLAQSGLMYLLIGAQQGGGGLAFVVDDSRRLLYHPDPQRIGMVEDPSAPMEAALRGE